MSSAAALIGPESRTPAVATRLGTTIDRVVGAAASAPVRHRAHTGASSSSSQSRAQAWTVGPLMILRVPFATERD
jgi:hypothetical protein